MKKSCLESLRIYSDLSFTLKVLYYAHFPVYAIIFGCLLEHLCQKHFFFILPFAAVSLFTFCPIALFQCLCL